MENPRVLAIKLLSDCEKKRSYSNLSLKNALKQYELSDTDAKLLFILVNGVLEKRITIDFYLSHFIKTGLRKLSPMVLNILRIGVYQILYLDKVPDSAACDECVKLTKKFGDIRLSGFVNGVLRSLSRQKNTLPEPDKTKLSEYYSIKYSIPEWIVSLWLGAYPQYIEQILEAKNQKSKIYLRVNTLKTDVSKLKECLANDQAELTVDEDGRVSLEYSGNIETLSAFQKGLFHVQGLSSQLSAEVVAPKPGEDVLDLCSAPGGKAFTMAELASGKAKITAMDIHSHRVQLIEDGAERLGLSDCILAVTADATGQIGRKTYDKVLVDAPCSGLGVIKKKPDILFKTPEEIDKLPELQLKILTNAATVLNKDGLLVYSTCTLNPAENENVIQKFVEHHQNFKIVTLSNQFSFGNACIVPGKCVTILPDNRYDGFFIAALQRVD